ncbi:Putative zinc-finger [Chthonomonas calidirosea]|uniref:anti-sigma factor family protein n=1 Tax=Chthonomonas calidirosea TaxID=454171 RepID=UPI0006DD3DDD|nr:zf-HC2 domain-containing protein [Chthonomonas calidirosea]CEK19097.1 Putative zinc-finger [Chthonomonas calidirosea]
MRDFENLTCRSTQLLLWDYLTGRLPEERMEDVERHLAACESCRVELDSMKETHQWLRIAYSSEVPEPRSGWHTLRARLVQEELIPATSKRHTVPVVLLALLFLLPGFLAGRLLPHERTPKPTGLASTSVPSPGLTSEPSIIAPPHSDTVASSLLGLDNPTISTAEDDTVTAPPVKRHQSTKSEEHHPHKYSNAPKNVPITKSFKRHSSVVPTSNAPVLASKSEASAMTSSQVAKAPSATQNTTAEAQFVLTGLQPDSPDRQTIY